MGIRLAPDDASRTYGVWSDEERRWLAWADLVGSDGTGPLAADCYAPARTVSRDLAGTLLRVAERNGWRVA